MNSRIVFSVTKFIVISDFLGSMTTMQCFIFYGYIFNALEDQTTVLPIFTGVTHN
jgi:hypothetical protein